VLNIKFKKKFRKNLINSTMDIDDCPLEISDEHCLTDFEMDSNNEDIYEMRTYDAPTLSPNGNKFEK
jgi:hypothetical protein